MNINDITIEIENLSQKINETFLKSDTKANDKEFDRLNLKLQILKKERYYKELEV